MQLKLDSNNNHIIKLKDIYTLMLLLNKSINIIKFKVVIKFVKKQKVYRLNLKYRKKNKITNIISFPYINNIINKQSKTKYIGDIIICPEVIKNEARKKNIFNYIYCIKMVIHAILHLIGFDHKNYFEYKDMNQIEKKIMLKLKNILQKKIGKKNAKNI